MPITPAGSAAGTLRVPHLFAAGSGTPQTPVSPDFASQPAAAGWPLAELDVVAAQVELGRAGRCMLLRAPVANGLAVAQPSNWSTFTQAWSGEVDAAAGPVVIWMVQGSVQPLPAAQGGFAGTAAWSLAETNVFYAADVDGDGLDELVVFDGAAFAMGVMKWSQGAYWVWWSTSGFLPAGGTSEGAWSFAANDTFVPARLGIGAAGSAALVARNPGGYLGVQPASIGVLSWTGTGLVTACFEQGQAINGGNGQVWTFTSGDQAWTMDLTGGGTDSLILYTPGWALGVIQWDAGRGALLPVWTTTQSLDGWPMNTSDQLVTATLDGKADSLVLFNSTDPVVAVVQWSADSGGLGVAWLARQTLPPNPGQGFAWQMSADNVLYAAALGGEGVDWVFFTDSAWLGAAAWDGTQLVSQWQVQGAVPGTGAINPWNRSASDVYAVVSAPVPGTDQLFVRDPSDGWLGFLAWNGGEVVSTWQTDQALPSWGPALVAAGPATGYAPFVSSGGAPLAEIYAYISDAVDPASNGDLRAEYLNTNDASTFAQWAGWLGNHEAPPADSGFPAAAWTTVQSALRSETRALSAVYGLYANLSTLAAAIQNQQSQDLGHVIGMLQPDDSGKVAYWIGQVFDALLWGAAALCGDLPAAAFGLSAVASLFGASLAGSAQGPTLVQYLALQDAIDAAYGAAEGQDGLGLALVAGDPVKASVVYWMSQGAWAWPSTEDSQVAAATQSANRIAFYQMLVPSMYAVWYGRLNKFSIRSIPSWAFWTDPTTEYEYTITLSADAEAEWPSQAMMSDLFGMGVQPADFYEGHAGWSSIGHNWYWQDN